MAKPVLLDSDKSVIFLTEEIGRTLFGFMLRNYENLDVN